jgi:hypothetical protein
MVPWIVLIWMRPGSTVSPRQDVSTRAGTLNAWLTFSLPAAYSFAFSPGYSGPNGN